MASGGGVLVADGVFCLPAGLFLVAGSLFLVAGGMLPGTQRTNSASRAQNRGFCAREEGIVASGSVKWPSCKSPRTLSKCKCLITS